jgi:CheY-like chemotaxis protein
MPMMSGLECLHFIKKYSRLCHIPVAIITTASNMEEEALKAGAIFYFTKPVGQDSWSNIFSQVFSEFESISH